MKPDALLIIDIQNGFMSKGAESVIAPVVELVSAWPQEHIYYLKYRNYPDSLFARHLDWQELMTSPEVDFVSGTYREGSPVFEHFGYKPPDDLIAALKQYKTVGICGVDTDACVMAAVFTLWDADIRPVILEKYCASSGGAHFHEAALGLMLRQFGTSCVYKGIVQP